MPGMNSLPSFSLGCLLEAKAKGKTSMAIKRLMRLKPKTARVIRDGKEIDIPIEAVMKGDLILVRPGEKIPTDGMLNRPECIKKG